jgi:putative ABC transport system substrate-binding protein
LVVNVPRVAPNVARIILKCAKPTELASERPTRFEAVIKSQDPQGVGLMIPASLLRRADQVIE